MSETAGTAEQSC